MGPKQDPHRTLNRINIAKKPIKFNSGIIELLPNSITLTQKHQYKNFNTISIKPAASTNNKKVIYALLIPKDQYIAQHTKGAYITFVCQSKALFNLFFAA